MIIIEISMGSNPSISDYWRTPRTMNFLFNPLKNDVPYMQTSQAALSIRFKEILIMKDILIKLGLDYNLKMVFIAKRS